jgi:hypothetical protein
MSWVYLLGKLSELQRVLTRETHLADSSDGLTVTQRVHLMDWTKEMHLVDSSEGLMVILTDAGKVVLLDPTKETRLVSLLAQSMARHWVAMMVCLTEMHWVKLTETHWVLLTETHWV